MRFGLSYAWTLAGVLFAAALTLVMSRSSDSPFWLTPLTLVVVVAAAYGGLGPGSLALLLSALALDYYVVEPGSFWSFSTPAEAGAFFVHLAGLLVFCLLAERGFRRLRRDRELRLTAERDAAHADRIVQLMSALSQARTARAVIEAAVQEPIYALAADAGVLLLTSRSGDRAEAARAVGFAQLADTTVTLADKSPISDAVGRGAPISVESRTTWNSEYPGDGASEAARFSATVAVPLLIGSRVVAVIQLYFLQPRSLAPDDREYLDVLGARAAQALDRAWQLEFAERARAEAETLRAHADRELGEFREIERALRGSETRYRGLAARMSRLHALTGALSEAPTLSAVAHAVIHHGRTVVGATAGEVMLLVENATQFDTLYVEPGRDAATPRLAADDGLCATHVVRSGQPAFIGSFAEWQERFWRSASIAADGGYESSATMPLLVEGAPIGVLAFHFTMPVNFDEEHQSLLMSVARHCAQALDRARLYEATQRARAEAEQANRSKDEFVSIVSHELRSPLSAIIGWASMLQRGGLDADKSARALQSVRDNASRQARLIDELLDFSRVTSGRTVLQMESVPIREIVRDVVDSMTPTATSRGIQLSMLPVPPVQVRADAQRLEQVFFNLIDNALKFTPQDGEVKVDVRIVEGRVAVRVADTGAGIDAVFLPFVFDRFRQADATTTRTHGGLGLGLSIAKQLVDAHGGSISVESGGVGCGSTFTVTLPIAAHAVEEFGGENDAVEPGKPAAAGASSGRTPKLDGVRVLVVDDERDARDIMAHALEACGARVLMASNVRDAIDILERFEVDALLADISMPDEDGLSLIRRVRASKAARLAVLPAAAVTALTQDEHRQRALAAGFQMHVTKPFDPAQLASTVEMLARGVVH
jgi:K+-sensing histidine kinase KdpD/CheY-like chemotaxis protein